MSACLREHPSADVLGIEAVGPAGPCAQTGHRRQADRRHRLPGFQQTQLGTGADFVDGTSIAYSWPTRNGRPSNQARPHDRRRQSPTTGVVFIYGSPDGPSPASTAPGWAVPLVGARDTDLGPPHIWSLRRPPSGGAALLWARSAPAGRPRSTRAGQRRQRLRYRRVDVRRALADEPLAERCAARRSSPAARRPRARCRAAARSGSGAAAVRQQLLDLEVDRVRRAVEDDVEDRLRPLDQAPVLGLVVRDRRMSEPVPSDDDDGVVGRPQRARPRPTRTCRG